MQENKGKSSTLCQQYTTTRGEEINENGNELTFLEVVAKGLANNGGLFIPKEFLSFDVTELTNLLKENYQVRTLKVLEKFPLGDLSSEELKKLINASYTNSIFSDSKIVPVSKIGDNQYLVELYHGPTAAFKDVALQLVSKFFGRATIDSGNKYLVLAATSGDTGVAAIEGYKKEPNVSVMVLFPKDGVSDVQKMQMLSSTGNNVFVLGVDGDFDFCQSTVKKIFNDKILAEELLNKFNTRLNSANSINWGRLMPQVSYHVSSYLDLVSMGIIKLGDPVDVCIPCGNFGNLLAAFIAGKMGIPFRNYISASNENNVLTDFINTGIYDLRTRKIKSTYSPSCDILKASNIERLIFLLSNGRSDLVIKYMQDLEEKKYFKVSDEIKLKLKKYFKAGFCSNIESLQVVKKTLDETGVLIDTHTAIAKKVADDFKGEIPILISSTAHFSKFPQAILQALGGNPEGKGIGEIYKEIESLAPGNNIHPQLIGIDRKEILHKKTCSADFNEIVREMKEFLV